jgi:hypothetical protein
MAEWIKARTDLDVDPVVIAQADALGLPLPVVAWAWIKFWGWAREHTSDGRLEGVTHGAIDRVTGVTDFARTAGKWIVFDATGCTCPDWEKHNSNGARERFENSLRQRKSRQRKKKGKRDICHENVTEQRDISVTRREEKRREESNSKPPLPPKGAKQQIEWNDGVWSGISDTNRTEWTSAYPSVNIDGELAKATAWLRSNPDRAGKRNWSRFLNGWFARAHERSAVRNAGSGKPAGLRLGDGSFGDEQYEISSLV